MYTPIDKNYYFCLCQEHSSISHLPILIPVVFDDELEAENEDDETTKFDKNLKLQLIADLTAECNFSINMSEVIITTVSKQNTIKEYT